MIGASQGLIIEKNKGEEIICAKIGKLKKNKGITPKYLIMLPNSYKKVSTLQRSDFLIL